MGTVFFLRFLKSGTCFHVITWVCGFLMGHIVGIGDTEMFMLCGVLIVDLWAYFKRHVFKFPSLRQDFVCRSNVFC